MLYLKVYSMNTFFVKYKTLLAKRAVFFTVLDILFNVVGCSGRFVAIFIIRDVYDKSGLSLN
ncbi:hypothetical protein [uncultured Lacinutrix sp.]|uniref:hypothetical protein n=1 Tax=uncultured Lacinutrix sp. TaxID=574032 RepID=UPI002629D969|nr:hypothetical protein [uncultured Lacinutrix sp.]